MKTVLVCGDRNWTNSVPILRELNRLKEEGYTKVIEGGAKGADTLAARIAEFLGMEVVEVKANWTSYGKAAGPIRNSLMLDMAPDLVLAFHPDITLQTSKGTRNTVTNAMKRGMHVQVFCE